jgi:hypothetical protein
MQNSHHALHRAYIPTISFGMVNTLVAIQMFRSSSHPGAPVALFSALAGISMPTLGQTINLPDPPGSSDNPIDAAAESW